MGWGVQGLCKTSPALAQVVREAQQGFAYRGPPQRLSLCQTSQHLRRLLTAKRVLLQPRCLFGASATAVELDAGKLFFTGF